MLIAIREEETLPDGHLLPMAIDQGLAHYNTTKQKLELTPAGTDAVQRGIGIAAPRLRLVE
jgi:hypothetical protein